MDGEVPKVRAWSVYSPNVNLAIDPEKFKEEAVHCIEKIPIDLECESSQLPVRFRDDEASRLISEYFSRPEYYRMIRRAVPGLDNEAIDTSEAAHAYVEAEEKFRELLAESRLQVLDSESRFVISNPYMIYAHSSNVLLDQKSDEIPADAVSPNELVFSVTVSFRGRPYQRCQEFLVLGSQPLSSLRERIYCMSDRIFEESVDAPRAETGYKKLDLLGKRKIRGSAFFYFEGVFYNDLGTPECVDYSK